QAPRPARVATAAGAAAAYGGVIGATLARAGAHAPTHAAVLAPGAAAGALLLLVALVFDPRALRLSLWLGGAPHVAFPGAYRPRIDAGAPLMAVLLLLCGEFAAWSRDERLRMRRDPRLVQRRALAVGALALGGLAIATLAVALTAAPPAHGLPWTLLGAVAA